MDRRLFLTTLAVPAVVGGLRGAQANSVQAPASTGRLKHGVTRNTFGNEGTFDFDAACRTVAALGVKGYDFATPANFPVLRKYGMVCSMYRVGGGGGGRGAAGAAAPAGDAIGGRAGGNGRAGAPVVGGGAPAAAGRGDGPNLDRPLAPAETSIGSPEAMGAHRDAILEAIDVAAANDVPNIFLTAGSRRLDVGIDYARGADNAVAFCNSVKARAESKGVTLCMEFLNSKGYASAPMMLFDHMAWGVDVCKRVNSPRVKILYDIFHAQIMEGFIVQTIRDNIQYIGHVHTGGVPGRHELDDRQELNYRFIAQALADLNYTGFVTHEWSPTVGRDYLDGLKQAIEIMRV